MKHIQLFFIGLLFGLAPLLSQAAGPQKLVETGLNAEGNCFCGQDSFFGKKKKHKKFKTFGAGLVVGGPVGLGGRVIFRPSRLAVVGDIGYNRIRNDQGSMTNVILTKTDLRLYGKGLLGKLLRPYIFGGLSMQRGSFNEANVESVFAADAGVGGGIKLWRLEINAEAGLLVPIKQVDAYRPGLNVFSNIGILVWLL